MSELEKRLQELVQAVAPEPDLQAVLRLALGRLVHDMNNTMGVLSLEVFNLDMVREDLRQAVEVDDGAGIREAQEELASTCQNLKATNARARQLLQALTAAVRELPAPGAVSDAGGG